MYDKLAHGDVGAAALRPVFIEGAAPRSGAAVPRDVCSSGGRGEHTVAEGDSAESNGGTKVRIFSCHTFSEKGFFIIHLRKIMCCKVENVSRVFDGFIHVEFFS